MDSYKRGAIVLITCFMLLFMVLAFKAFLYFELRSQYYTRFNNEQLSFTLTPIHIEAYGAPVQRYGTPEIEWKYAELKIIRQHGQAGCNAQAVIDHLAAIGIQARLTPNAADGNEVVTIVGDTHPFTKLIIDGNKVEVTCEPPLNITEEKAEQLQKFARLLYATPFK